jgi:hypothetical protein
MNKNKDEDKGMERKAISVLEMTMEEYTKKRLAFVKNLQEIILSAGLPFTDIISILETEKLTIFKDLSLNVDLIKKAINGESDGKNF